MAKKKQEQGDLVEETVTERRWRDLDEDRYSDNLDMAKDATDIHVPTRGQTLSRNFVFADLEANPKLKEFTVGEKLASEIYYDFIPDKRVAARARDFIMMEVDAHAILNRNTKGNPLLRMLFGMINEERSIDNEDKKQSGVIKRILGKVQSKEEKERERDERD